MLQYTYIACLDFFKPTILIVDSKTQSLCEEEHWYTSC